MRGRVAGRIVAAVAVLVAVVAVIAVLAMSDGDSVPSPTPTAVPSAGASTQPPMTPSAGIPQSVADAPLPSDSVAASWTQTTEAASAPDGLDSPAAPPGVETEALDLDASARAALSAATDLSSGQLALADLPSTVGQWSADDELGPVAYTKAGGRLEDTITVTSLGADSMGLDHWRSAMTDATPLDGGLCGLIGGVAACVLPSAQYGEVMLFGADGVGAAEVSEVASGVSAAISS